MASPDTIVSLIVDYHAVIRERGKTPCPPLRTPLDFFYLRQRQGGYVFNGIS